MPEFMYQRSSLLIAAVLLASLLAMIELGYRLGRRSAGRANDSTKNHIGSIQGSLLGILALLLGFAFSLALQRYEARSEDVVTEANAIGTTLLRAELLPDSVRADVGRELRDYVDLRVDASLLPLTNESDRTALLNKSLAKQNVLWAHARRAAKEAPGPITALFVSSLNETIDAFGARNAALGRHVPELVLLLLYITFLMTASVVGFSAGHAGHRASFATYILMTLIVLLVFIIIDLDRPRRGLIEVDQGPLLDLQTQLRSSPPAK